MSTPFIAEIKIVAFPYAPKNWATCDGQLLPIQQNQALFSLLGTTYGGNGTTTFALPDFRGRTAVHTVGAIPVGTAAGFDSVTLTTQQIPQHTHSVTAMNIDATENSISSPPPFPSTPAIANTSIYSSAAPNAQFAASALTTAGSSQPHENRQPYLVLLFIIALQGVYPSRS